MYISSLLKIDRNTSWNVQDNVFYIITYKWFDKWKNYIDHDKHSEGKKDYNYPGPIYYKDLLADDKDYYHNYSVSERMREKIIKESAKEGRDFLVISKESYDYLQEKYDGEGVERYKLNIGCNGLRKLYPKLVQVPYLHIK